MNITSNFAILDVKRGRAALRRLFDRTPTPRIPVTITGLPRRGPLPRRRREPGIQHRGHSPPAGVFEVTEPTPTLDEQIAAVRLAAEFAERWPLTELPDLSLRSALATLEGLRLPLLADPVPLLSTDDEREAQIRYGASLGYSSDADLRVLVRRLDAARLALSGAQAAEARGRAAGFEAGEACAIDNVLGILDEEGWLGNAKQRIRDLLPDRETGQ